MSEYYIKQPNTDHARGPLSLEQLVSLADTGTVTDETLLYDDISENWKPLAAYPELLPLIFPQKKKLSLNRVEPAPTAQEVETEIAEGKVKPKVSTEQLLADATGDTKKTRHIVRVRKSKEKAASLAVPGIGGLLVLAGLVLIFPIYHQVLLALKEEDSIGTLFNPLVMIGILNLFLALGIFLGMTSLFSMARVSGAIMTGMLGYLFWAWQNNYLAGAGILMGVGLFAATISTRFIPMAMSLAVGFAGGIVLAFFAVTGVIVYPGG